MRWRQALLLTVVFGLCSSCAELVQYSSDITRRSSGRSRLVTTPATVGGVVGMAVGLPVSVVALPVTWGVYRLEKERAPLKVDKMSTFLFPSFALWRAGTIALGAPFDAVEYATWRVWAGPVQPTDAEQEELELELDRQQLPSYPVETLYPPRTESAAPASPPLDAAAPVPDRVSIRD